MNTNEPAGYRNFSLLGWTGLLAAPWKGMLNTISSFRKAHPANESIILTGDPNAWFLEEFNQPIDGWLEEFSPTAGKSVEELRSLRKETVSAIWKNHNDLSETIYGIARITEERAPDSKTRVATLDTQFGYLMSELEKNEKVLADYNRAISKFFSRRHSDKRTDRRSVHI